MIFAMVGLAGLVALGMFAANNGGSITSTTGGDAGVRDNSCIGLLYPNITDEAKYAAAIDDYIPDNSPLNGLGKYFVSGGKKSGINPALLVAHTQKESSFATCSNCVASKGGYNAFGRRATSSQPNIDGWYKWSSWVASLDSNEDDEPTYIKRVYIEKRNITNLTDYINTYAPPTENDTAAYILQMQQWMQKITDKATGAVTCQ